MKTIYQGLVNRFCYKEFVTQVFCKSLFTVFTLKFIFSYYSTRLYFKVFSSGESIFGYSFDHFFDFLYFILCLVFCLLTALPLTPLISGFFFIFSYLKITLIPSLVSGVDLVFFLFLFYAWLLTLDFNSVRWNFHGFCFNDLVIFLFKINFGFIYFQSGIEKVFSDIWRSGEALYNIRQLPWYFPEYLVYASSPILDAVLCWIVILFQLSFLFLVWIKEIKPILLFAGIIFELFIFYFLSLPDFSLVMLCGFIPFFSDGIKPSLLYSVLRKDSQFLSKS